MAGPTDTSLGKAGNAPIVRQGHTTNRKHGSDPNAKAVGRPASSDLKAK